MDWSLIFKFATQRVFRLGFVVGIILLVWHLTLTKSGIPYINNPISWITTLISPFLAFCGFNVIYYIYKRKWNYQGEGLSDIGPSGVGFDDEGGILVVIGLFLFMILLPIIAFYIPVEAMFGVLYYKQTLWEELVYSWETLTFKEGLFVVTKAVFLLSGLSFLFWEILLYIGYGGFLLIKYVTEGKNNIPS